MIPLRSGLEKAALATRFAFACCADSVPILFIQSAMPYHCRFFSFDSFDDSFDDEDDPEAAFAIFTAEGLMSIRVPRRVPL